MARQPFTDWGELRSSLAGTLAIGDSRVSVENRGQLRGETLDRLVYTAVFGADDLKEASRWLVRAAAAELGIYPASIHDLYMAAGRGAYSHATAPAINIRGLTFDTAQAVFRAAKREQTKIVIFEIARSEMGYTEQRPAEYAACVLAAAIKAEWSGPVFIQGDHFQASASAYAKDPEAELQKVRDLTREAIAAGFYNIDIDASTLVELERPTVLEQQDRNFRITAEMTELIRSIEPAGITVSVGGEIGEVGGRNSTVEDLAAFMEGYLKAMAERAAAAGRELAGISKISVQTGTSHGGVVLPDGTIAKVNVDFDTLAKLSEAARERYGLGGAVQHGASTLPETAFNRFAEANAIEVHLATAFQNLLYDHALFPPALREQIYAHLAEHHANERKPNQTDAQFYYTTRKRGYGPFKRQLWDLDAGAREQIMADLENMYALIMNRLGVAGRADLVDAVIKPVEVAVPEPEALRAPSLRS